jgi:hypothetical protein
VPYCDIAVNWLDWGKVGPMVKQFQSLIAGDVQTDTRKIFSSARFTKSVTEDNFIEQRRTFLLKYSGSKPGDK